MFLCLPTQHTFMPSTKTWQYITAAALIFAAALTIFTLQTTPTAQDHSVLDAVESNPEAQYFRDHFPVESVQAYILSEKHVEQQLPDIKKECGPSFSSGTYWKITYTTPAAKDLVLWYNPEERRTVCINQHFINQSTAAENVFHVVQNNTAFTAGHGSQIQERLYVYTVGTNLTHYVTVTPVETPWGFSIEPPLHPFKPVGRPEIQMNIAVEPVEPVITKQKQLPPSQAYIQANDTQGYVPSSFLTWETRTPRKNPRTREGVTGEFPIVLNVTAYVFENNALKPVSTRNVTYTVTIP